MQKTDYIRLAKLKEKKNEKTGETFLFGKLGECTVFVFKNNNKAEKGLVDYNLMVKSLEKY